jgi:hypothetical protein
MYIPRVWVASVWGGIVKLKALRIRIVACKWRHSKFNDSCVPVKRSP